MRIHSDTLTAPVVASLLLAMVSGTALALPPPDTQATENEWATGSANNGFSGAGTKDLGNLSGRVQLFGLRFYTNPATHPLGGLSPDYYRFSVASTTTLRASLNNWGIDYSVSAWPILGVFTQAGAQPPFPLPLATSTTTTGPAGSYQSLTVTLAPGTYAIVVTGNHYDNETYWVDGGISYDWPYELTLDTTTSYVPTNNVMEQEWLPAAQDNNVITSAQPLGALPAFMTVHGLRYPGMRGGVFPDFYSFTLAAPRQIAINLNTWGRGYVINFSSPRMAIFAQFANPLLPPLAASTTSGTGTNQYQTLSAVLQPGTYVLGVGSDDYDDDDHWVTGGLSYPWPYEVEIEASPLASAVPVLPGRFAGAAVVLLLLVGIGLLRVRGPGV